MVALGEEGVREKIRTIGLFNSKAKNVVGLSRMLIDRHDSKVPASREALQELPGVGRKTASVVMNEAFGAPTIAVDTHVFRVANRTGSGARQERRSRRTGPRTRCAREVEEGVPITGSFSTGATLHGPPPEMLAVCHRQHLSL